MPLSFNILDMYLAGKQIIGIINIHVVWVHRRKHHKSHTSNIIYFWRDTRYNAFDVVFPAAVHKIIAVWQELWKTDINHLSPEALIVVADLAQLVARCIIYDNDISDTCKMSIHGSVVMVMFIPNMIWNQPSLWIQNWWKSPSDSLNNIIWQSEDKNCVFLRNVPMMFLVQVWLRQKYSAVHFMCLRYPS